MLDRWEKVSHGDGVCVCGHGSGHGGGAVWLWGLPGLSQGLSLCPIRMDTWVQPVLIGALCSTAVFSTFLLTTNWGDAAQVCGVRALFPCPVYLFYWIIFLYYIWFIGVNIYFVLFGFNLLTTYFGLPFLKLNQCHLILDELWCKKKAETNQSADLGFTLYSPAEDATCLQGTEHHLRTTAKRLIGLLPAGLLITGTFCVVRVPGLILICFNLS